LGQLDFATTASPILVRLPPRRRAAQAPERSHTLFDHPLKLLKAEKRDISTTAMHIRRALPTS
jgi:hypothetical protein